MTDTNTPALPAWLLSADDMKALIRFAECAEDWDTDEHDVSKEAMKRLERLGAVRSLGFGRHETTAFGDAMLAAAPEVPQVDSQAMQADELQANVNLNRDEIAGLRARIAELEADNSEYEAFVNECRSMSPGDDVPLHGLADRMRADKRALRIDAERCRWIRDKERFHIDGECGDATFSSCMCCAEEFDDALDDAMAQPAG